MKIELLEVLRCPQTGQRLTLEDCPENALEIEDGWLIQLMTINGTLSLGVYPSSFRNQTMPTGGDRGRLLEAFGGARHQARTNLTNIRIGK